jgi:hypothetical protein
MTEAYPKFVQHHAIWKDNRVHRDERAVCVGDVQIKDLGWYPQSR